MIEGTVTLPDRVVPETCLSLRAPAGKALTAVQVDGIAVDAAKWQGESVMLHGSPGQHIHVHARFT